MGIQGGPGARRTSRALPLGIFHTKAPRTFRLVGTIDLATEDQLIEFLRDELKGDGDVTLELSGVTLVDSRGLRALVWLAQSLTGRGRLILRSPPSTVCRSLQVSGVDRLPGIQIVTDD